MGHTIKLDLPDEVYESLRRQAAETGKTIEESAYERLSTVQGSEPNALLRLAGVIESDLNDVAERHDHYIGQRLAEGLKPGANT